MSTAPALAVPTTARRIPLAVTISAWAAPVLVVFDFALLAIVPVAVVLIVALRDQRVRVLRWPAALLAVAYAVPLALWRLSPEPAESLSKDIDPLFVALILLASAVVLVTLHTRKR